MTNTRRLGRYPVSNNNDDSISPSYFDELASFYRENGCRPVLNRNKILFGHKRTALEKVLASANKTIERSTKFLDKSKQER